MRLGAKTVLLAGLRAFGREFCLLRWVGGSGEKPVEPTEPQLAPPKSLYFLIALHLASTTLLALKRSQRVGGDDIYLHSRADIYAIFMANSYAHLWAVVEVDGV